MWHSAANNKVEEQVLAELDALSDRAAAITGAVFVEDRLDKLLKSKLRDGKKSKGGTVFEDMFRSSGPLGSFSAKINLGFMIGAYESDVWSDLDRMRDIRNNFAHEIGAKDFSTQSIADKCRNLGSIEKYVFDYKEAATFSQEKWREIHAHVPHMFLLRELDSHLRSARKRYLLCAAFYTSYLAALTPSVNHGHPT